MDGYKEDVRLRKAFIMSTPTPIDFTDIVLLLANFTGVDDILELSNNLTYSFTPPSNAEDPNAAWLGQLRDKPKGHILCLKFGEHIFSAEGWVFGSAPDTDAADVQLALDNRTGVSKRHFRIDINPLSCYPRVTVLSRSLKLGVQDEAEPVTLTANQDTTITSPTTFDAYGGTFLAWQPKLTTSQTRVYRQKAFKFCQEAVGAIPRYFPPIESGPETITSNEPYYKVSDNPGVRKSRWEELKQEYENLFRLDHPYIVKVHDLVPAQDDKEPAWLIEDYIPDCLCPQELDEQSTVNAFIRLFSALAYAHSLDIVHRDLKPSNILMKDGNAILGDFGAARHRVQGKFDTFTGTPVYLAPEFLQEPRSYSNKVDMFSCGMILLECLSSWNPQSNSEWPGNALDSRRHAKWMREIPLTYITEVPFYMRPLLRGLLRRYPEERWSALHSLVWLSRYTQTGRDGDSLGLHLAASGGKKDEDQDTVHPDDSDPATPQRQPRKRPASASLSPGSLPRGVLQNPRRIRYGDDQPSSELQRPPSQSLLVGTVSELPSTVAWGAPFVTSPSPVQVQASQGSLSELPLTSTLGLPLDCPRPAESLALRGSPSELASTLPWGAAFVSPQTPNWPQAFRGSPSQLQNLGSSPAPLTPTLPLEPLTAMPPPLSPQQSRGIPKDQPSQSPTYPHKYGASGLGSGLRSPSWAPTPDRDEGEFPVSGEDNEYSMEESDTNLFYDWNENS
ncbi:Protein kinase-like domain protein [Metarhizium rileyi]|uniref:non-specific serine/threonine protein kinase n=1 Tax=Metarhizium rileyi (strain RCEF 4871) TaxID=1649241 RepID=A0A166WEC2_METRR|nr:Protein kinase-like domain protein [Metarhizium rileyi RCEF 4871]